MNLRKVRWQRYLLNTKYQSAVGVAGVRKILSNYGLTAPRGDPNQRVNTVVVTQQLHKEISTSLKGLHYLK